MQGGDTVPWFDDSGRFSPLKLAVLTALFLPALWIGWRFWHGDVALGRPDHDAIREVGRWAIRLMLATLAITPLRWSLDWPRLLLVRRMIGVAAFAYAVLHVGVFAADQGFDLSRVATEIIQRWSLKIGFYGLLIMAFLAATSTDGMVRSLGAELWRYIHRSAYAAAAFAVAHHFMQAKTGDAAPWVMAGLFGWLIGYRLAARRRGRRHGLPVWGVAALGITAAALTCVGEALYGWIATGANPARVLAGYFDGATLRPGWIVLAIGLLATGVAFGAGRLPRRQPSHLL